MARKGEFYNGGSSIGYCHPASIPDRPGFGKAVWKSGFMTGKGRYRPKPAWLKRIEEFEKKFRLEKIRHRRGKKYVSGRVLPDLSTPK